jgi:hypothetical protein
MKIGRFFMFSVISCRLSVSNVLTTTTIIIRTSDENWAIFESK